MSTDLSTPTVQYYGTGKRKTAVARVFLRPGMGHFKINDLKFEDYFKTETLRKIISQPFQATETAGKFDVLVNVQGGGLSGQADAVQLGISRALLEFNVELRKKLREGGFLTRDARIKERKKYGQKGARKRFQYSKR